MKDRSDRAITRHRPRGGAGNAPDDKATRSEWRRMELALRRTATYPHPAGRVVRIETHISVVYLVGRYAYKICKPVNLGFVDFTTRAARYRSCRDALRLNRRLAASLYLGVVPIVRIRRTFRVGAEGAPFDHALKMRRFDERDTLSALIARGALRAAHIDRFAARLASFHAAASRHAPSTSLGSAKQVREQVDDVLASLERNPLFIVPHGTANWCCNEIARLKVHIDRRRDDGFVRECHGDLHLENMVSRNDDVVIFDCIEFSDALRWIDITADIAFVVMDLLARERGDLATRFLNVWVTSTGDFLGLAALRLYVAYRALVRMLVTALKTHGGAGDIDAMSPFVNYSRVVDRVIEPPTTFLILCHGFSGSGKSVASEAFTQHIGAIRISSDVERKRNEGAMLAFPKARTTSYCAYTREAIDANYARLRTISDALLSAGFPVVVDASFLHRAHRASFIELAASRAIPVFIVDFRADVAVLVERLNRRATLAEEPSDADESVLRRQLIDGDPLTNDELAQTVSIETDVPVDSFERREFWFSLLERLGASRGWLADLGDR